ncbi:hypothetical protein CWS35_24700 [Bradyrhizobium sp. SK17]|uniref:hypothetical protein n=1 Tax=Bradyrhizobium sp. SK17 TaxID=2057741 RepID=UPI000C301211|nr:hypothetical protein [Bradyrhizobium sp. SK17]AUC97087.1 hypothetical protein CWS35_24700 [Bradyrhizobium sp. SK17]
MTAIIIPFPTMTQRQRAVRVAKVRRQNATLATVSKLTADRNVVCYAEIRAALPGVGFERIRKILVDLGFERRRSSAGSRGGFFYRAGMPHWESHEEKEALAARWYPKFAS